MIDEIKKAFAQFMVAARRQAIGKQAAIWEANHVQIGQIEGENDKIIRVFRYTGAGRKGRTGAQLREIRQRQVQIALERSKGRWADGTVVDTSRLIDLGAK